MEDQAVRSKMSEIVGRYGKDPTLILSILQDIQAVHNYLLKGS